MRLNLMILTPCDFLWLPTFYSRIPPCSLLHLCPFQTSVAPIPLIGYSLHLNHFCGFLFSLFTDVHLQRTSCRDSARKFTVSCAVRLRPPLSSLCNTALFLLPRRWRWLTRRSAVSRWCVASGRWINPRSPVETNISQSFKGRTVCIWRWVGDTIQTSFLIRHNITISSICLSKTKLWKNYYQHPICLTVKGSLLKCWLR